MGSPSRTGSSGSTFWMEDQIVVSVGPYIFHSSPTSGSNCPASPASHASPPQSAFSRGIGLSPARRSIFHVAGVACNTVTGSDRISKMRFDFELGDPSHLDSVIGGIKQIDGIYDAYRVLPGKGEVVVDKALVGGGELDEPDAVPAGEQGAGLNL